MSGTIRDALPKSRSHDRLDESGRARVLPQNRFRCDRAIGHRSSVHLVSLHQRLSHVRHFTGIYGEFTRLRTISARQVLSSSHRRLLFDSVLADYEFDERFASKEETNIRQKVRHGGNLCVKSVRVCLRVCVGVCVRIRNISII